jgi:phosphohistidine phosphatase SixA
MSRIVGSDPDRITYRPAISIVSKYSSHFSRLDKILASLPVLRAYVSSSPSGEQMGMKCQYCCANLWSSNDAHLLFDYQSQHQAETSSSLCVCHFSSLCCLCLLLLVLCLPSTNMQLKCSSICSWRLMHHSVRLG